MESRARSALQRLRARKSPQNYARKIEIPHAGRTLILIRLFYQLILWQIRQADMRSLVKRKLTLSVQQLTRGSQSSPPVGNLR
jgi:hypothetical protein